MMYSRIIDSLFKGLLIRSYVMKLVKSIALVSAAACVLAFASCGTTKEAAAEAPAAEAQAEEATEEAAAEEAVVEEAAEEAVVEE